MTAGVASWVCCHLGAREHYAVPRALHSARLLRTLITDAWWRRRGWLPTRPGLRRLGERFHPDLADADVESFTGPLILHEAASRLAGQRGWDAVLARNVWFQARAVRALRRRQCGERTTLFAHSYSAREVFREAKSRGWTTVLGQIDPGEEHFRIVSRLEQQHPEYRGDAAMPPEEYFAGWREECALADLIVVNSEWSREALARAGVSGTKLRVIPLPYDPDAETSGWRRQYPRSFTAERPLRVLFVGTASAVKGVPALLEAIEAIGELPVELRLVGERDMRLPPRLERHPRVIWTGAVSRQAVMAYYRDSDVLMFPSHSDGFGMAQVEAQAWSLPIVASPFCGRVVRDDDTGILLPEVTPASIGSALRRLVGDPGSLVRFADNIRAGRMPGIAALASALAALSPA